MSQNRYLTPLLSVHFVGTLGFSIILPFLVFIVERFQGNSFVYGLLGATYPAFQFIGAPILGKWSDKYGRKRILLLSQLGTLLSWGVFLLGLYMPVEVLVQFDSEWTGTTILTLPITVLFLARALDGLTGGNISVANAYLADISTKEEKSRNYGKMSIAANFGFVLGPVLAGLLSATALQETLPVLAAILISTAALVTIFLYLPDVRPCEIEKHDEDRIEKVFGQELKDCFQPPADKHALKHLLAIPGIPFLLLVYFAIFLGFNFFYTAFPVHASAGLKWPVTELGIYLSRPQSDDGDHPGSSAQVDDSTFLQRDPGDCRKHLAGLLFSAPDHSRPIAGVRRRRALCPRQRFDVAVLSIDPFQPSR